MNQPKNETETHYLLKEVAKYILWSWGYTRLASEVDGMWSLRWGVGKQIIDAVGAKKVRIGYKPNTNESAFKWDIKGIEAKASLSDFRNGFCTAPAYTYIIAPKEVIPISEIPKNIGFIEVDFKTLEITKSGYNKINKIDGVKLVLKAKKKFDERFANEESYQIWCQETVEKIAYRNAHELLFWKNSLLKK